MSRAFYNERDPYASQWLRNLEGAGHIAPGDIREDCIRNVRARDVAGHAQAHFFAGIGVWSHALRLAGWPDDREVWTGSCPCQPFSQAGAGDGFADPRHLWPVWFKLIRECRPRVIFGEQVASPAGLEWLDLVSTDLENEGYAVAAFDLCAAGVGAPHIRQRIYFGAVRGSPCRVADDDDDGQRIIGQLPGAHLDASPGHDAHRGGTTGRVADDAEQGRIARGRAGEAGLRGAPRVEPGRPRTTMPTSGFWADPDWLPCRDGKYRPVEPRTFPLAHGAPSRVGRLRAYGNAIVAPLAATFIRSMMETLDETGAE